MAGNKVVLINATSVKYGGAATILQSLVDYIAKHDSQTSFVLLCGYRPDNLPDNVQWLEKQTQGLSTLWFSTFGILWYVIKYRAGQCVSLANINLVIPLTKRITYFHQAKVFESKGLRFRLMSLAIHLLRGSKIVVQSPLIKQRFEAHFSNNYEIMVKWPGLQLSHPKLSDQTQRRLEKQKDKHIMLWPVTSPFLEQKNLAWFERNQQWLEQHNVVVWVTSEKQVDHPCFESIGLLAKADLMALYAKVDRVIITSLEETVCLPIFEAASQGAKVSVLDRPYIRSIEHWRGLPPNVQIFNQVDELLRSTPNHHESQMDATYYQSDWQIYST